MVKFRDLYMLPSGKMFSLIVQVEELEAFKNMYIDSILLDTSDTYQEDGPSDKAITLFLAREDENIKEYKATIDIAELGNKLFFVHVICKGTIAENAPCGVKARIVTGVVYNKYNVYKLSVNLLYSLKTCELPNDLINYVLGLKAFELAIKAGEYKIAAEYWKKFFEKKNTNTITSCNCHG